MAIETTKKQHRLFSPDNLSAFSLQLSLLPQAGISTHEGMEILAEDSKNQLEKQRYEAMAISLHEGKPFHLVL